MTLDTRVYVLDPIDYRQVFVKCNQLIGATEGTRFEDRGASIMNLPGQDLCAWLIIDYGKRPMEVSFDTAYGYSGPEGGCGDLHARLVRGLGEWLDGKGVRWSWLNEWTSEVHEGYERLTELGGYLWQRVT